MPFQSIPKATLSSSTQHKPKISQFLNRLLKSKAICLAYYERKAHKISIVLVLEDFQKATTTQNINRLYECMKSMQAQ